jgi:hypothetical protein
VREIEHQIQVAYFVAISYHPDWRWIHAIPNGGKRSKAVAGKMKAEGVKRGVADVFVPYPRDGYQGMYIEFKALRRKQTDEQKEFQTHCDKENYLYIVCYDADEAYRATRAYLSNLYRAKYKAPL